MSFEFGYSDEFQDVKFDFGDFNQILNSFNVGTDVSHFSSENGHISENEKCVESLKQWLADTGSCAPHRELLRVLSDEDALRLIGAKSLNSLLRQVPLTPQQVSEIKLLKRRLRKRLAKRCWDQNERVREVKDREVLEGMLEEKDRLECERKQLVEEINTLEQKIL